MKSFRAICITAATILILGWAVFAFLKASSTYLVFVKPTSGRLLFNGGPPGLTGKGSFIMQEFYGTHRITATFPDSGVVREVLVFPSLGDDESTSLEITPTRVICHGDLKDRIVR